MTPAAHYLMGGVTTDLDRAHHAARAVRRRRGRAHRRARREPPRVQLAAGGRRVRRPRRRRDRRGRGIRRVAAPPRTRRRPAAGAARSVDESAGRRSPATALQELMWEDAGLVRDARGLEHAASVLAAWRAHQRTPRTEAEFEDENLLLVAEQLVAAALRRRESVGAHFRRDDPRPRPQRMPRPPSSRGERGRLMLTTRHDRPRRRGRPRRGRALGRHHERVLIAETATARADLVARETGRVQRRRGLRGGLPPDRPRDRRRADRRGRRVVRGGRRARGRLRARPRRC